MRTVLLFLIVAAMCLAQKVEPGGGTGGGGGGGGGAAMVTASFAYNAGLSACGVTGASVATLGGVLPGSAINYWDATGALAWFIPCAVNGNGTGTVTVYVTGNFTGTASALAASSGNVNCTALANGYIPVGTSTTTCAWNTPAQVTALLNALGGATNCGTANQVPWVTSAGVLTCDSGFTYAGAGGAAALAGAFSVGGVLQAPNGSNGAPGIRFAAGSSTGFYAVNSAEIVVDLNGSTRAIDFSEAGGLVNIGLANNATIGFSPNGDPGNGNDIALSRCSAGVVCFGTGAQGSTAGSWKATNGTVSGNLNYSLVSSGAVYKAGSNARTGTGTLSSGTLAVANTSITTNSQVFVQDTTSGALTNVGSLVVVSQTAGVGFTVTSSNVLDTSTFRYWIFETN